MLLNTIPKKYLKGKCLEAANTLRDAGTPTLSLQDYLAIMYADTTLPKDPVKDTKEGEQQRKDESSINHELSEETNKITITKVYPWYLS